MHLAGGESDFATLHKLYGWMVFGIQFVPQNGLARMVPLINFEEPGKNIFRAVNQFVVEYTNNGQKVPPPGRFAGLERIAAVHY